jgi:hypothetical protein
MGYADLALMSDERYRREPGAMGAGGGSIAQERRARAGRVKWRRFWSAIVIRTEIPAISI